MNSVAASDRLRVVLFGLPGAGKSSLLAARSELGETPTASAILLDSDGRAAEELVAHPNSLQDEPSPGKLTGEIAQADALILTIDASATPERLAQDFAGFDLFLRVWQQNRSARTDVGGLPVFLVLTKCDLLAKPTDST